MFFQNGEINKEVLAAFISPYRGYCPPKPRQKESYSDIICRGEILRQVISPGHPSPVPYTETGNIFASTDRNSSGICPIGQPSPVVSR